MMFFFHVFSLALYVVFFFLDHNLTQILVFCLCRYSLASLILIMT